MANHAGYNQSSYNKLPKQFRAKIKNRKIVVLGMTDDYDYMDAGLVRLFERLVPAHLGIQLRQGQDPDAGS